MIKPGDLVTSLLLECVWSKPIQLLLCTPVKAREHPLKIAPGDVALVISVDRVIDDTFEAFVMVNGGAGYIL